MRILKGVWRTGNPQSSLLRRLHESVSDVSTCLAARRQGYYRLIEAKKYIIRYRPLASLPLLCSNISISLFNARNNALAMQGVEGITT